MLDQLEIYQNVIFETLGPLAQLKSAVLIAAGNQNQGVKLATSEGTFFLKLNFVQERAIFAKESEGLQKLRNATYLKVPQTFGYGRVADYNYLLSEFIPTSRQQSDYWEDLGLGLAQLHLNHSKQFGLDSDNFIASLHQKNDQNDSWPDFFIRQRLEPMLGKAYFDRLLPLDFLKKFQTIYSKMDSIFPKEKPSLLHGDLWSGNVICDQEGKPCLIDPAVYFGHREMDLAFSKLFGGFDSRFYDAYESIIPLEPDFESRIGLYNLYPLLVHLNLFGVSYLPGIEKIIKRFQ